MKYGLSSALLALCTLVGCSGEQPSLKTVDVRLEVKDKIALALGNIAKEGESIKVMQNAIKAALESVAKENGSVKDIEEAFQMQLTELFPSGDMINGIIGQMLDSEFAKAIFSERNVISSSDSEVTYRLSTPICDQLSSVMPGDEVAGVIMMCKMFLSHNTLDLHVKAHTEKSIEVELWHAANIDGSETPAFVLALQASPNVLGTRLSLDGAKGLVEAVQTFIPSLPIGNTEIEGFKKLTGEFSLRLQFASSDATSGCQNDERLCFVANIDRDIKIETQSNHPALITIGSSPSVHPTATVSARSGGNFAGAFNFGAINASFDDSDEPYKLFLETISFKVSVPKMDDSNGTVVFFEKIKTGPKAAYFEMGSKKMTLQLTNDSKSVELIKTTWGGNASASEMTVSPLALAITYADDSNSTCKANEKIQVKTAANTLTTIKGKEKYSRPAQSEDCANEVLFGYEFFKAATVSSDTELCEENNNLQLKKGGLSLQYDYSVNGSTNDTISLNVAQGQCIAI